MHDGNMLNIAVGEDNLVDLSLAADGGEIVSSRMAMPFG
jgi:hypothetical protein